jgi:hypothetical protein
LLQKSLSGGLRANSRNIRLSTDVSLNQKCAWIAKFGIFFSAQTPKIFLQQYRPISAAPTSRLRVRYWGSSCRAGSMAARQLMTHLGHRNRLSLDNCCVL